MMDPKRSARRIELNNEDALREFGEERLRSSRVSDPDLPPRSPSRGRRNIEDPPQLSEEANLGQLEPANVANSPGEANLGQLEPANVAKSPEDANLGQLEPANVANSPEANLGQLELANVAKSPEDANLCQLEPANVANSPEDANLCQLEPADVANSPGEANLGQLKGADVEDSLVEDPEVLLALLGEGGDRRERAEAWEKCVAVSREVVAGLREGRESLEKATANLRQAIREMDACMMMGGEPDYEKSVDDPK